MRTRYPIASLALAVVLFPHVSHAQGQAQRRAQMRFADMDRNGDGVIARSEWRGSDQSFRVHDWNNDGVLSGDEVRPGAQRGVQEENDFYAFHDWTARGFRSLDDNGDDRITRDEWHFDPETFSRADHNRDGALSRAEFLGADAAEDDDRNDRFRYLDQNNDGRLTREEWHGSARQFDAMDENRDGVLTRREMVSGEPPPDLFTSVDVNRDGAITRNEWHWSRASFDERDANRDGRLTREEFDRQAQTSPAYRAGYDRGLTDGRNAGREDRERNQGWDLEGQRELEGADAGYEPRLGARADYQAGYREAFRRGYREGFGR
jgi:Ca2+-binding EF-hand superfamily protein